MISPGNIRSSRLRLCSLAAWLLIGSLAQSAPAWGPEGHKTVVILATRYMRPGTIAVVRDLLGSQSIEDASLWADTVAHSSRPEAAPWHYIDIPLRNSTIELNNDCPHGQCVLAKTQQFLAVLADPHSLRETRSEALKFVLHFVADLHQPLHCEDNHDRGGNAQEVIFEHHPDNLHWVWDTGLVQENNPDPRALAAVLGRAITDHHRAAWVRGGVRDWVLESHRLAQTVAYGHLQSVATPVLNGEYDRQAETVVGLQLEKASVRLAYVLNERLDPSARPASYPHGR